MNGIVRYLNLTSAMVAVETREGFTVFELRQRCALDIGDMIEGPLDSSGEEVLHNVSREEDFAVFIERIHCNGAEARRSLGV
jgi:hypothetical protein